MRRLRDTDFVLASVGLHLAGAVGMLVLHPSTSPAASRVISVEIRKPPPLAPLLQPAPLPPPAPVPPAPVLPPRLRPATPPRPVPPPVTPPPVRPVAPPPPPVAPTTPPPPTTPRKVDLFSARALGAVVGSGPSSFSMRDSGGRTSSLQNGGRDPNQRDSLEDRENAKAVLGTMIVDSQDKERLAAGRVPPALREAERVAKATFNPPAENVTDDNAVKGWLQNWANTKPEGGKTPRGFDDSASSSFLGTGAAGATQSDVPEALRKRVIVEVVVAPDGTVLSSKLVHRSGRRKFDAEALATVTEAVRKGGKLEGAQAMVTRWSVEAWVNVAPPSPTAGFSFDEVSGKVGLNHPMKKSVQTKVALVSLRPRD